MGRASPPTSTGAQAARGRTGEAGMKTLFLGIDPGGSGGIAIISTLDGYASAWKMGETETDTADLLRTHGPAVRLACIEEVHALPPTIPGNTSKASFAFGQSYGFLRGLLVALQIPFMQISPNSWKKQMGLRFTKDNTATEKKNGSKQLAQQLFPQLRITHATAEALLLAEHCRR